MKPPNDSFSPHGGQTESRAAPERFLGAVISTARAPRHARRCWALYTSTFPARLQSHANNCTRLLADGEKATQVSKSARQGPEGQDSRRPVRPLAKALADVLGTFEWPSQRRS
jgi:hypothetical protein